jgi:MFS family permease
MNRADSGTRSTSLPRVPFVGRRFYGWTLVWSLGLTTIVAYGTTLYLFGVLIVPMQSEFGWSRALISGAFSLGFIVHGLLAIPIGRLVDHHGARLLLSIGSVVTGISLLVLSRINEPWQLYAVWGLGIGAGMALTQYPVTFTVISNWFITRRGTALAIFTLVGGLASPMFIPFSGWLIGEFGWRNAVVVLAIITIVTTLPIHALLVRRRPEDFELAPDGAEEAHLDGSRPVGMDLRRALSSAAFWMLAFSFMVALLGALVIHAHQVPYIIERGFNPLFAATIAGLVGFASLPGRYLINRLSDRFDAQRLLALCSLVAACGVLLLSMATTRPLMFGYVLLFGATWGAMPALRASTNADHFGREAYGAITSVMQVPATIASAFGPLAAGYLHDKIGNYLLVLWLDAGMWLIAALIVWFTPHPPKHELLLEESKLAT